MNRDLELCDTLLNKHQSAAGMPVRRALLVNMMLLYNIKLVQAILLRVSGTIDLGIDHSGNMNAILISHLRSVQFAIIASVV